MTLQKNLKLQQGRQHGSNGGTIDKLPPPSDSPSKRPMLAAQL